MKKIYIFLLLLSYTLFCFADPIDKKRAAKIAEEFYKQQVRQESGKNRFRSSQKTKFQLDYICKDESKDNKRAKSKKQDNNNLYYVFNADKEQGFVIVAGDDKAGEVLAYSSSGNFSHSDMPDNLKDWMSSYKDAIKAIVNDEVSFDKWRSKTATTDTQYSPKVLPLLEKEGIKWDQGEPYNRLCPEYATSTRAATGCVATAMSQVMRYYKHPQRGVGYHEYTQEKLGKISANFDTVYDWVNMLPKYTAGKNYGVEGDAVAKLMHHVGVSVNMHYGPSSGTNTGLAKKALVEHFAYDKSIDYLNRKFYSSDEWNSIIKKELNEKRPVIYSGQSKGGGHAFICDGYDSNNLFHINWGWSGMSDGYFDLAILEPSTQGTGGGTGGYTFDQSILIGIQPEKANSNRKYTITYDKVRTTNVYNAEQNIFQRLQTVRLYYLFINRSSFDYSEGSEAVHVVLKDGNSEHIIHTKQNLSILNGTGNGHAFDIKIPQGFPNGSYKLGFKFKNPDSGEYFDGIAEQESLRDINIDITGNSIEFKYKELEPKLELIGKIEIDGGKLYSNRNGSFTFNLKNSGDAVFRSKIALHLVPNANGTPANGIPATPYLPLDDIILGIEPGKSKTLNFKGHISVYEGDYMLEVCCVSPNKEDKDAIPNASIYKQNIKVVAAPAPGSLQFSNLKFKKKAPLGEKFVISFDAENRGAFCAENIEAQFFRQDPGVTSTSYSHHKTMEQAVTIDRNGSTTISFELETESLKVGTKFLVQFIHNGKAIELETYEKIYFDSDKLVLVPRKQFSFEIIAPDKPLLSCTPKSLDVITITNDSKLYLNLPVTNSGAQYNDKIIVQFLDNLHVRKATVEGEKTIINNEEKTIQIKDNDATLALLPGTYTLNMLYQKEGKFIPMEGNYGYLEIEIPEAKLVVVDPKTYIEAKQTFKFEYNVNISNMGGAFNEDVYLDIIPTEKPSASGQETVTINANLNVARTATGTVQFAVELEDSKFKVGDYTVQLKQKIKTAPTTRARNNKDEFKDIGLPTKLTILTKDGKTVGLISNKADKASLKIQQYADNLVVDFPKDSETLYIYDMTGRLITRNILVENQTEFIYPTSRLSKGLYLVVAEGKFGKIVEKVLLK